MQPKMSQWNTALSVVRYIKLEPGEGLLMSSELNNHLIGFCDTDWVACPNTKRFVTAFLLKLSNNIISWRSKK